jgi:hypothetical protein
MVYSDFKSLKQLEKQFGIEYQMGNFVESIVTKPSPFLLNDLQEAIGFPTYPSEKAKSELLIMPFLKEVKRHEKYFQIFSGFNFDVDSNKGLNGFCDFILSKGDKNIEIKTPVFCIVEAKDRTVEEGFAQVIAEMYAAQLFNETEENPTPVVYGCVTNSDIWVFLKLENKKLVTIEEERFYLIEPSLSRLLGVFIWIIKKFE